MKEGNVPCTNTASDPMHSPSAEFTSQRRMGSAGEAKKHPPADVHWIVEGGWGGEGETTAGRAKNEDLVPAQSWTFISFRQGTRSGAVASALQSPPSMSGGTCSKGGNSHATRGPKRLRRRRAACAVQRPQKTGSWCGFLQRVSSGQRDADGRTRTPA